MAKSSNLKKNPLELGDSGVQILNGIITGDEYRHELRGRNLMRTIEEMRRGDATIKAGLSAVKQPIIAADWSVEPGGESDQDTAAAELVDYNFTQVLNWKHTLAEILTMLDFGFSVFELVYGWRSVNGVDRIVLIKCGFRKQTTIERWSTQDDQPGIVQRTTSGGTVSIPDDKLLILTHQQEGDNWEGVSILRSAYQNWYYKKTLYQIDAVRHERQALGVVKIKYPKNASEQIREQARLAAQNVRANERAYIEEPDGWDINFMDMQANTTADPKESIAHHDRQILKNMAVQYIDIGSQGSSGSFSASTDQRRLLELQDQAIAEQIASKINDKVVRALVDLNFNVTDYPKWTVGRIGEENVQELSEAVSKMVGVNLITPTDGDEEHARKVLRFPDMPDDVKGRDRTPVKVVPKAKEQADEIEGVETEPKKDILKTSVRRRNRRLAASVSSRDFPNLYDGTGVDPEDLGCIMVDVEPIAVMTHLPDDFASDLIDATSRHDHAMGAVAEKEAHVTLLYGLLENGNTWKDKVDAVLEGWSLDTVKIHEVGFFETPDSFAVIAHVVLTPELIDGHERLTLLPHIQTFSEYKPHITLAYVSKDADINEWVSLLGDQYNGTTVKVSGINYGDLPKNEGNAKVDAASLIDTAQQLHAAITDRLYGPASAA